MTSNRNQEWGQVIALIGNARQATSEGKSGLVEAGLTGTATTALYPGPNSFMVLQARPTFTREGRVWWTAYWYMLMSLLTCMLSEFDSGNHMC